MVNEICERLHQCVNNMERFSYPFPKGRMPSNGICIFFENGELARDGNRIVLSNTHTGHDQLIPRLDDHFERENKDRSIFRKHVGRCFLKRDNDPFLEDWERDLTSREARERYGGRIDFRKQRQIEEKITEYVKSVGAVSCQSGTAGLHIALKICGVTKDHEVIVPTLTFIAAVNPVKYVGAEPIFMDCDDSLCMDADKLEEFCENECEFIDEKLVNKTSGKHIKAVVVVHVFGNMADMGKIMDISSKYNLKVVEDATEALGTYYKDGRYEGLHAGTIGDVGVYSFNGNKIITTGGGGMIVSMDEGL